MLSFHQVVKDDFAAVNDAIIQQLHSRVALVENIGHYIVDAGGKRLRQLLVLLVANALGYRGRDHIEMAAVVEFIHTATLLHDDVVDVSSLRRGRPTANANWGNAPSVLVGDFLYSRAFEMLVELGRLPIMQVMASATNIISEGEVLQLVNAGDASTDEPRYRQVISNKTAKLFEAAAQCAAIITDASDEQVKAMAAYGHHLGMAFQLIDDVLDYAGSAEEMGKNVGDDLAEGKPTLPLIYTLAHGSDRAKAIVHKAISEKTAEDLDEIAAEINANGALDYTRAAAETEVARAIDCLACLDDSPIKSAMIDLANFSVARRH